MKSNVWKDIGKLYDPQKQESASDGNKNQTVPDEPKKKETKAIRRKHGKNSKI